MKYAKEVLMLCNVSRLKDPRALSKTHSSGFLNGVNSTRPSTDFLRKGDGKLSSNIDYNNLEVYEKIREDYSSQKKYQY